MLQKMAEDETQQTTSGKDFVLENPFGSAIFSDSPLSEHKDGTDTIMFDACRFGATDKDT